MRAAGLLRKAAPTSVSSNSLGLPASIRIQNALGSPLASTRSFSLSRVERDSAVLRSFSHQSLTPRPTSSKPQISRIFIAKASTTTSRPQETQGKETQTVTRTPSKELEDEVKSEGLEGEVKAEEFGRSEKANQAAQLNLSARLSKEGVGAKGKWAVATELWRLLKIAGPEKRPLSAAFSLLLVSSSVTLSVPWMIGRIMDMANKSDGKISLFGLDPATFYLCFGLVLATGAVANFGRLVLLRIIGERIVARMRTQLYRRTVIQNAEFFDANRVGDLLSRLGQDTSIVGRSITSNLSDGLRAVVSGGAGLAMMTYVSPHLTSVLFIMLPLFASSAYFFGIAIRNLSRAVQRSLGDLTKIAEERLGNVRTVQSFVGERQEVRRYSGQVRKLFQLGRRDALLSATYFGTNGFLANMMILALLYIGGGMVQSGAISLGQLSTFLLYSAYTGSSMFGLSGFYTELMKGSGAASRLFELQDRHPPKYPSVGEPVKHLIGSIEFRDVQFAYPTRPSLAIFQDLTFTIEPGSNVAIVAPSGAGKSTIAQLLLRFYTPGSGEILINGVDISGMNAEQLRRRIGYVGQEPVLFSGTIAENIAYGRPQSTRQEILAAARQANCGFISDFPDSIDTQVGARGTQLSGGQKQRIAIARALIKKPDILILDEATSALDAESESLVNQALTSLLRSNHTTISIAHRLSTIKRSDRIVVIGTDGTVAETGSYYELSRNPESAFSKLMEWQLSGESMPAKQIARTGVDPRPRFEEEVEYDLEDKERHEIDHEEHEQEHEKEHNREGEKKALGEGAEQEMGKEQSHEKQ